MALEFTSHFMGIKVCFLVSDNGFSQLFCNYFYLDEIFSWQVEHLVCRKMVSKNFENGMTNKKSSCQKHF